MSVEKIISGVPRLFEGEEWFERRVASEIYESDRQVLEAVSQIPEFKSFTDDQKRAAVRFSLVLKDNVMAELMAGPDSILSRRATERQIILALETAKEVGVELTRKIGKVSIGVAEEVFGLKG